MQGIADELGVTAPALYSHVAGRDEVLALVNAALGRQLVTFTSPATDWRGWLTDFANLIRQHFASSAATLVGDLRAPGTSHQIGVGERGLQLLIEAGLTPEEAGYSMWLVFRTALTAGPELDPSFLGYVGDTAQILGPEAAATVAADLPATGAVYEALVADGPHDSFTFDLAVVLDGIAERIAASSASDPAPQPRPRPRPRPRPGRT